MTNKTFWRLLVCIFLLSFSLSCFAGQEATQEATRILNHQLAALKANDFKAFKKFGNKAFQEMFSTFDFETLYLNTKSELSREYDIQYLGSIHRIGAMEYLWKFKNRDVKKEHLVRMTLTRNGDTMAGFDFD